MPPTRATLQDHAIGLLLFCGALVVLAWTTTALEPQAAWAPTLDTVQWTCAFCAAAWFSARAARAASGTTRRVRIRFAWGLLMLAAGQVMWDVLAFIGWNPFPGIPNLLYLMLSPCFILGFTAMAGEGLPRARWRSILLDVGGFGLAVLAFTLALYLPYAERVTRPQFAVLTAYPVLLFCATAAGIIMQLHLRQRLTPASLTVVAGLAGYGALWLAWDLAFLRGELHAGATLSLLFSALALLLGVGAARWTPMQDETPGYDRLCEALLRQVPLAMVAFTSAAVGFIVLGVGVVSEARLPLLALGSLVFLCAVVRQTQQLRDRDQLLTAERAVAESRALLQHQAQHDALTGLPNRALLRDRVAQALAGASRHHGRVALMFIDLDEFKEVNDTLGHATGDALLCHVAQQLRLALREQDTVCRQGGDEFAIVLPEAQSASGVAQAVERIMAISDGRALVNGHALPMSMSVGIAMYPEDGVDFDSLMQCADTAMYRAKACGRNAYRFYDAQMNVEAGERSRLRWLLGHAIERGELRLHFQPYFHLASRELLGAEVLLRWHSGELGEVAPGRFIPLAEEGGQIVAIGAWVLREACRHAAAWRRQGLALPRISVNLSVLQFRRGDVVQQVADALKLAGLPAEHLELEITESVLMRETDKVLATAAQLREMGVSLAIDDFGTGYSSLAYLQRLHVHKLKIDRSFVQDAVENRSTAVIVRAIVEMARALDVEAVAEGIETQAQHDFLAAIPCAMGQGFLLARPMPPQQLERLLVSLPPPGTRPA